MSVQKDVEGNLLIPYGKGRKKDAVQVAGVLNERLDQSLLSLEELADTLRAGVKGSEIVTTGKGKNRKIQNPDTWFNQRFLPNTIRLSWEDYLLALLSSLEIVVLGKPSRMDFGPRRRGFAQQWTNFLRGYLGEIALKKYLSERYETEVELEQVETAGGTEKYLPTDVTKIKESGEWREVRKTLSIKTTKLKNVWLAIRGGRLEKSDAFTIVKIGIPANHLAVFLKEIGALENLVEHVEESSDIKIEEEFKIEEIRREIPGFNPIPAYIPGFCWKRDFENGTLETEAKQKHLYVTGGIGRVSQLPSPPASDGEVKVMGWGTTPSEDCLSASGALRWKDEDWEELLDSM